MSKLTDIFSSIAASIRAKTGGTETYKPEDMAVAIGNMQGNADVFSYNVDGVWTTDNVGYEYKAYLNGSDEFKNNFNYPVHISNDVTIYSAMFEWCTNFNQPVTISPNTTDMSRMFNRCFNFNQPITMPKNVVSLNLYDTFAQCRNFNHSIQIIADASNYANWSINMHGTFFGCYNFNWPVRLPSKIGDANGIFGGSCGMNYTVTFGTVDTVEYAFGSTQLNKSVVFAYQSPQNARCMFYGATSKKRKRIYCHDATPFIKTDSTNSVTGVNMTWSELPGNNGYYNITYNVFVYNDLESLTDTNMSNYFSGNTTVNKAFVLRYYIQDATNMFNGCTNFNCPISMQSKIENASDMFHNCTNFNQDLMIIGTSNMSNMFRNCVNFYAPIAIYSENISNVSNMYYGLGNTYKHDILCYPEATSVLIQNNSANSITGTDITWTAMDGGNGYYNTTYNIYIYNNLT